MNKGLIRLTLAVGLAVALGACGGDAGGGGGSTPTPAGGAGGAGGTGTTTTPPASTSSPTPKETSKSTPGATPGAGGAGAGGTTSPTPTKKDSLTRAIAESVPNKPSLRVKNRSLLAFFHLIDLGLKLRVSCCLMLLLKFSTSPYCRKVR